MASGCGEFVDAAKGPLSGARGLGEGPARPSEAERGARTCRLHDALAQATFAGVGPALEALAEKAGASVGDVWELLAGRQREYGSTLPTGAMLHLFVGLVRDFGGTALSLGAGRGVFEALAVRHSEELCADTGGAGMPPVRVIATEDVRMAQYARYHGEGDSRSIRPPEFHVELDAGGAVFRFGAEASVLFLGWPPQEDSGEDSPGRAPGAPGLKGIAEALVAWVAMKKAAGAPYAVVMVVESSTGGPSLERALKQCGLVRRRWWAPSAISVHRAWACSLVNDYMVVLTADKESAALADRVARAALAPPRHLEDLAPAAWGRLEKV
jgi:hypothetical protein